MYKAVEFALSQVGYLEKSSPDLKYLYDKTANAGDKNYTYFAYELDKMGDVYNSAKNGFPWCEVFIDFCFIHCYSKDIGLQMICQPRRSAGAGCTQSSDYYKNAGRFFTGDPREGDQIFFSFGGGDVEHTGLVYKVTDSYVYTVEGNTSGESGVIPNGGGVFTKRYLRSNWRIYGYGRPKYSLAETADKDPVKPEPEKPVNEGVCEVELKQLKMGDSGAEVRSMQALLIKKFGISCGIYGADGEWGSATQKAVLQFQSKMGLSQDAICGQNTWTKLLK